MLNCRNISSLSTNLFKQCVLMLLFLIFLLHHWYVLLNIPLLPGFDGGYYAVQVREILRSGNLYYSAPPLAFFIFALFAWIFLSLNIFPETLCIINGVKFGLALMKALCVFPMYLISKQLTKNEAISIGSAVLLEIHPFFMLLANGTSLYKNAVGIFFLLCYIYFVNRVSTSNNAKDIILAVIFLGLTALTHILDFGIAIAYTLLYITIDVIRERRLNIRTPLMKLFMLECIILGVLFVAIIVFFPIYFGTYYKFESFFKELITHEEASASLTFLLSNLMILVTISFSIVAIIIVAKRNSDALNIRILISSSLLAFFLISPEFSPQWHIRFIFVTFIPLLLMIPSILNRVKTIEGILLIFLLLFSIFLSGYIRHTYALPVISPEEKEDLLSMAPYIPRENTIVVTRFGLHYWVTWFLDVKSSYYMNKLEDYIKEYDHVFIIFNKQQHPNIPPYWTILFVGRTLILIKVK